MGLDCTETDSPTALARLVEQLAATDAPNAVAVLARLEAEVARCTGMADTNDSTDRRVSDFRRLVASLRASLRQGHVCSLTGLERQVRLLTRVS